MSVAPARGLHFSHQLTATELEPERPSVLFEDFAGAVDFGFAGGEVFVRDVGEVVEVVEIDIVHAFHCGVDIAGEC